MPARNTRLRPKRSASPLPTNSSPASATRKASRTHWSSPIPAFRSSEMSGRATLTIVMSIALMNIAPHTTSRPCWRLACGASPSNGRWRRWCGTRSAHRNLRPSPPHGRLRSHHRRRRRARAARLQPRPGDLPRHRARRRGDEARRRRVLPRGRGRHHARARAAADDARALAEGRAPGHRPLDAREGRRRRLLPEADPEGRAGLRGDRAHRVPVGPPRRRDLPDRDRRGRLGGADGHDHLPPVAGARATTSTIPTSCASTSTRSRAPTSPTPCASPPRRASCSTTSATPASRRPRAAAASTSTCGSSRAGRSPTSATPRSPSAASSSGACPAR